MASNLFAPIASRAAVAASLTIAAHVGFLLINDLAANLAAFYLFVALGFVAVWLGETATRWPASKVWMVLGVGVVLRILLVPLPPSLSDDVLRYVWDGRVFSSASNPYALAPSEPELAPLRDELWRNLPHKDVATVYPPLALIGFSITSLGAKPIVLWKCLLAAGDLVTCWLLLWLCRRWGLPEGRSLWYAWNPLVTVEIAGMGHIDGLGVLFVVATVAALAAASRHLKWASLLAAGAVLVKLIPLLLVPLWARSSRRPVTFLGLALVTVSLGVVPVLLSVGGVPPGLVTYGVSWEFNGPLYEPLWRGFEAAGSSEVVEQWLNEAKVRDGRHEYWNQFYPYNYARLHAKILLASLFVFGWLVWLWRAPKPLDASGVGFALFLLCSATVYPWYLLWVMPWAALRARWEWRCASASIFLAYWPQWGSVELMPWVFVMIWAPLGLIWLILGLRARLRPRVSEASAL